MLISPILRDDEASTLGGGATIAASGARKVREDSAFTSAAGATTFSESIGDRERLPGMVSGAGATAVKGSEGSLRFAAAVDASGIVG